ncbi:hypothetical protein Vretifemale_4306, partial [Volvox reticuliferus]
KLAAAASESARHADRAEDWRQWCTTLESVRESELDMHNALAAEKAQLGALLATAQHKADVAQQFVEELHLPSLPSILSSWRRPRKIRQHRWPRRRARSRRPTSRPLSGFGRLWRRRTLWRGSCKWVRDLARAVRG